MNINDIKQIKLQDFLAAIGCKPVKQLLLSDKSFFDRYAVLLERAKSKGLISFCEVSP